MATTLSFFLSPILSPYHHTRLSIQNFLSFRIHHSSSSSLSSSASQQKHGRILNCSITPTVSTNATQYEFHDDSADVELRLELGDESKSPSDVYVDATENSLVIRLQHSGYTKTLLDTDSLYGMIKPSETIWYIDDTQLVINLKKQDPELKWHDIVESWESLTTGVVQLLKGTSIFIVGESTEINNTIARELAVGLGYTPLSTKELIEAYTNQTIDSSETGEGSDSITKAEADILESLSRQARVVVATLGGKHGAARRPNKWQHLFAGFTVWLSPSEATGARIEGESRDESIGENSGSSRALTRRRSETGRWCVWATHAVSGNEISGVGSPDDSAPLCGGGENKWCAEQEWVETL